MLDDTFQFPRVDFIHKTVELLRPCPAKMVAETYKSIVGFVTESVVTDVSNYTHIPIGDLPKALDQVIIMISVQTIDVHKYLSPKSLAEAEVKTLSEGDTSITYNSVSQVYANLAQINTVTGNYTQKLNTFRRLP